jgi:CelD/BcsL family acetyltransferase involved in cellulose biosynthesis
MVEVTSSEKSSGKSGPGGQSGALQVRVLTTLEELELLRPAWEELLAKVPTASIFSTWDWLAPWWRAYGGDRELLVLAFYAPSGELAGLAPLSLVGRRVAPGIRLRTLEFMGDGSEDSDNMDILAAPGQEDATVGELLRYLQEAAPEWDVAQLNLFPSYSPTVAKLKERLSGMKWALFEYTHPWCVLHLPDSWEGYLKQISRKERDKILYYERRLRRLHKLGFRKCTSSSDLTVCLQALFDLHQMRWELRGEKGSFAWEARRQFYWSLANELISQNQLEFWLMDVDDKPAAAQYGFRYRDTVYLLQEGFDVKYAQLSVQDVLHAYVFRQLIENGIRHYDFLGGVSLRKQRWGAAVANYVHLHFARPSGRGSLFLQGVHKAQSSRTWLREHVPTPVKSWLRRMRGTRRENTGEP